MNIPNELWFWILRYFENYEDIFHFCCTCSEFYKAFKHKNGLFSKLPLVKNWEAKYKSYFTKVCSSNNQCRITYYWTLVNKSYKCDYCNEIKLIYNNNSTIIPKKCVKNGKVAIILYITTKERRKERLQEMKREKIKAITTIKSYSIQEFSINEWKRLSNLLNDKDRIKAILKNE